MNQHVLQILTQGSQAYLQVVMAELNNLKHLILKMLILSVRKTLKIHYVLLSSLEVMLQYREKHLQILLKATYHRQDKMKVAFGEIKKRQKNSKTNLIIILSLQEIIVMKILTILHVHK